MPMFLLLINIKIIYVYLQLKQKFRYIIFKLLN